MEVFKDYLAGIDPQHRAEMEEVLGWVMKEYPNLEPVVKWNQPMFTDHGTFIIAFSVAKKHMSVAPERKVILRFSDEIVAAGFDHSKELVRFPWNRPFDYSLLQKMIEFNIEDKADYTNFWRK
ncbi:iron chaperone [Halalkalibacillus sediminis]|uniref:Iron chaperone n=1 Tax=Halalkalibacillus sediminis TaxID=2018042 RepID=A0A2I0QQZ8_9BACI|nr:iron chaperone [Halalkalibacillus sediminis]PKR76751.1 iron chaperone [Halalkalibacillus sediminis]